MLLRVDHDSPVPLYEQLAAAVRAAIAAGDAAPGDRLPPARALATDLGVNMHTVLRAYSELRDEALVELRRGRGAVVRAGVSGERAALREQARALVGEARRLGLTRSELDDLIRGLP